MKALKLLSVFALTATMFTSCYREDIIIVDTAPQLSLNQVLNSYELWYVDINQTLGYEQTPFLQMAFTLSFRNGVLFANNNLVGFGSQGNGFGIAVGDYNAYDNILDVYHDVDGFQTFDVYIVNNNTIELYNPFNDTSYFLKGFQRSNFDYDFIFYDNIQYFLQEYNAWEKVYTSNFGALNEFDNENYLQFLSGGNDNTFRSSRDFGMSNTNMIFWDYTGIYGVGNIPGNFYLKTLTLDYDFFNNEFFELSVINDARIQLYHNASGTVYEFVGRGYIQYLRDGSTLGKAEVSTDKPKMRIQTGDKQPNPRYSKRS